MELIIFNIFKFLLIISGFFVIHSKNPIHSIIFLILVFANAAALLLLLEFEFLAMVLLVVYIGAIAVLFLFVVMMLNVKSSDFNESIFNYLPIGFLIVFLLTVELSLLIYNSFSYNFFVHFSYKEWISQLVILTNIETIGMLLYTYYFYLFLVSALVLLVAMVGAIVLTMSHYKSTKRQSIFIQVSRNSFETIKNYKI
jgi:NADH-quinone oxidoreductase subunit J